MLNWFWCTCNYICQEPANRWMKHGMLIIICNRVSPCIASPYATSLFNLPDLLRWSRRALKEMWIPIFQAATIKLLCCGHACKVMNQLWTYCCKVPSIQTVSGLTALLCVSYNDCHLGIVSCSMISTDPLMHMNMRAVEPLDVLSWTSALYCRSSSRSISWPWPLHSRPSPLSWSWPKCLQWSW